MADLGHNDGASEVAFEAFGVRLGIGATTPELLDRIRPFFPPGWTPIPSSEVESSFSLVADNDGTFSLQRDSSPLGGVGMPLDQALDVLDIQLRHHLGRTSPETIFIHAGAVAHAGKTIVIPAPSFRGKTTLVTALVRGGATYFSDEFAVIDRAGLIHPYPRRLSIRDGGVAQTEHPVESLGGAAADEPLPLGIIVVTTYRAGAEWKPKHLSGGAGALALLSNAVPAQERPKEVMEAVARAANKAAVVESDRGEADEVAPLLLGELERHAG
jgi:hypothetical protein